MGQTRQRPVKKSSSRRKKIKKENKSVQPTSGPSASAPVQAGTFTGSAGPVGPVVSILISALGGAGAGAGDGAGQEKEKTKEWV